MQSKGFGGSLAWSRIRLASTRVLLVYSGNVQVKMVLSSDIEESATMYLRKSTLVARLGRGDKLPKTRIERDLGPEPGPRRKEAGR